MILKLLGYYEPIVTEAIPGLLSAFAGGEWSAVWLNVGILFPFGVGILVGIFAIAKIIEWLLARWEGPTYCAILGLVTASPVAILMSTGLADVSWSLALMSLATFVVGFLVAWRLSGKEKTV